MPVGTDHKGEKGERKSAKGIKGVQTIEIERKELGTGSAFEINDI